MKYTKSFNKFFNTFSSTKRLNFKQTFQQFQSNKFTKHSLLILGFQLNTYFLTQKVFNQEKIEQPKATVKEEKDDKLKGLKHLIKYEVCKSEDIKEGQIIEIEVNDGDNGKKYPIVLVRSGGKVYAIGGICNHDGQTRLKDGICFGDKFYCPKHGCAYNITTGEVEYAPAIDDLPRFYVEEKQGKITLYSPKDVPKRLLPATMPRDYNDLRKVVIIGSGASAQACVETLRRFGYTGEIIMVTKETKYPYDKTKLSKDIKDLDYKDLQLRDAEWYNSNGVQIMFGRECVYVDKTHGSPHIKLEDGLRLEYDALVLACGSRPEHRDIVGSEGKQNLLYLENIEDHKNLRDQLKTAKSVSLLGANAQSLETASTIRQQYPNVKEIYIIDENQDNPIKEEFGNEIGQELIQQQLDNNVWFIMQQEIYEFVGKKDKIEKIRFENGLEIKSDIVLLFPNNRLGNTEWLDESNLDQFEFDDYGRIRTTYHMKSDYKRIFSIGDCSATQYYASNDTMPCRHWNTSWHQGETAAYNILALNVPYHQIPFSTSTQYGRELNYLGYAKYFNQVHIDGSVKDWDFIAYYGFYDEIVAVSGTPSKRKAVQIANEALRLEIMPLMPDIKKGIDNIHTLEAQIRKSKRSGCYRKRLYEFRNDASEPDVIWQQRDKSNEYYNVWDKGLAPVENKIGEQTE